MDQQGKEVTALYGTPGLEVFAGIAGAGPVRGMFAAANGRAFVVSNSGVYELPASGEGIPTFLGGLNTNSGIVSIAENGFQLAICDGEDGYILTYATNAFQQITSSNFPSAKTIDFIDGYFVVNENDSGKFYISSQYDGLTWAALDFATAESSPDELLRVLNAVGQLWLMGTKTTEIWTNTGASAFPFERISGAKMEVGIYAPHTALAVDNSLFWVGRDDKGAGIVYRAQGFTPQRISTNPIEIIIQAAPEPDTLRAYTYQEDGHTFYVITGGGMETTIVYDILTQQWHERAYLNSFGNFEPHLGACGIYAFGRQLVGSRINGRIYTMALNIYQDDVQEIAAERIFTHLSDEGKRLRFNQLEIAMETGVGWAQLDTESSDPNIALCISRDGGRTYGNWYNKSFGKVGEYKKRVAWRRLGIASDIVFKIRITGAVKRSLIGAYLT